VDDHGPSVIATQLKFTGAGLLPLKLHRGAEVELTTIVGRREVGKLRQDRTGQDEQQHARATRVSGHSPDV
jgi:hypothetical protein